MEDLKIIEDVIQLAKYKCWDTNNGDTLAHQIMEDIHKGKYGKKDGIWVQVADTMQRLKSSFTQTSNDE